MCNIKAKFNQSSVHGPTNRFNGSNLHHILLVNEGAFIRVCGFLEQKILIRSCAWSVTMSILHNVAYKPEVFKRRSLAMGKIVFISPLSTSLIDIIIEKQTPNLPGI